jgi:AcrR family transcriptional regulator
VIGSCNLQRVSDTVKPRRPTRRDRALATRTRIARAATELFCDLGYTGTKMSTVAERAGVAVQTVYFVFHTKAELLQACYELAVLGEDDPRQPHLQPWRSEMVAATSGLEALRIFAGGYASIARRAAVLDDVVRGAVHEPEAKAVRDHSEQLRRDGYHTIIEHLQSHFGLRADLDTKKATDLTLTLAGPSVYRTLVVDYGWTHTAYVDWLARTLTEVLLPAEAAN